MINSRDIKELHPRVKSMCELFISHCKAEGINITVTSTYRDFESQNALYAQGRTLPGKKVTNAAGGQSMHNYRLAFDVVPIVNKVAVWNDNNLWEKIGRLGRECGLTWGGDFHTFKDRPHFQYTGGLNLKDLQQGKKLEA